MVFETVGVGFRPGLCLVKTFLCSLGNSREGLEPLGNLLHILLICHQTVGAEKSHPMGTPAAGTNV